MYIYMYTYLRIHIQTAKETEKHSQRFFWPWCIEFPFTRHCGYCIVSRFYQLLGFLSPLVHWHFELLCCVCAYLLSRVQLFATPWPVARQAPLSMGFSRQEYWSGLPCPPPGIFPTQGSKPGVPHCRRILYHLSHKGSPFQLLCESNPGQPELHKFPSSQRETYHFHRVTQSFPLLEWHWHLAPSPVVIAGSTCFISQNVLCLLQFLKSLHWKTNQKMSTPQRSFFFFFIYSY